MRESKYAPYKEKILSGEVSLSELAKIIGVSPEAVRMARIKLQNPDKYRYANRKWRIRNSRKENAYNRAYRAKSKKQAENFGEEWTDPQDLLVLTSPLKGLELAKEIGRTLDAIYIRRHRLKSDGIKPEDLIP